MPTTLIILAVLFFIVKIVSGKQAAKKTAQKPVPPGAGGKKAPAPAAAREEAPRREAAPTRAAGASGGYSMFEDPFVTPESTEGEDPCHEALFTRSPLAAEEPDPLPVSAAGDDLLRAVIWKEILDRPVSARR